MANSYLKEMFSLEGKTAVITGGTGGLGSEVSLALCKAGAAEIISIEIPNDPLSAALRDRVAAAGGTLTSFQCDLSDKQSIRACYASIWQSGAVPDILVNCAGVMRRNSCENATDEELELLLDVNIVSFYISMQEFGRRLISLGRKGKIINIASVTSFQAGFNTSVYSTTKGAVLQMTKAFSNEWAKRGIQVNCINPGFMRTAMTIKYQDDTKMTDYLMARVPMERWGDPEDLAAAVLFLAAPGNSFTSGAPIIVDGGFCGK